MTRASDDLLIRAATEDEDFTGITAVIRRAFLSAEPDEARAPFHRLFEPDRGLVVVDSEQPDGQQIVANAAVLSRRLTIPGGVVPAAHVTEVGVLPSYRRQGLLTRLMRRQLADIRAKGTEPLAVLWASEGSIYQRFGYGAAAFRLDLNVDRREVRIQSERATGERVTGGGRLREAEPANVRSEMAAVYDQVLPDRPGWSSRTDAWWDWTLVDPKELREGYLPIQAALFDSGDGVTGYALWRAKQVWERRVPEGVVDVVEVIAADAEAYRALWQFLLSVDLTRTVHYRFGAVDEPLTHLVNEPGALGGRLMESLWIRIVDLPAALTARRYARDVDVVLEVRDQILTGNAGRWRLRAQGDNVTCERTDEPADLELNVADLGAAYLAGTRLTALAVAGRVVERRPGTLATTSAAFGWVREPSAIETF
jgi:predicted acetyltransferase